MDTVTATTRYESWLAERVLLYQPDLDYKHRQMALATDPFPFFRGTYYLWVLRWAETAGDLVEAPKVSAVGDLHLENYGTWRDADGRLCWGVNDFDEADRLPYTNDLVRLAVSVRLAGYSIVSSIKTTKACQAILSGYRKSLKQGGLPFVLEEKYRRLRALATHADRDPVKFWKKLTSSENIPADPPAEAKSALQNALPEKGLRVHFRFRQKSGMGSLGKPRYLALAEWKDSWVAREAKAVTPAATAWVSASSENSHAALIVGKAIRSPDPFYNPGPKWILRRLAPRCSRIDLDHLRHTSDLSRLLRAMGAEAANIHLGTPGIADTILTDLDRRPKDWLATAARTMAQHVEQDWTNWRAGRGS